MMNNKLNVLLALTLSLGALACEGVQSVDDNASSTTEETTETDDALTGATDCRTLIQGHIDWVHNTGGWVSYQVVTNTASGRATLAYGSMPVYTPPFFFYFNAHQYRSPSSISSSSSSDGHMVYSDRTYLRGYNTQMFDATRSDSVGLWINDLANVTVSNASAGTSTALGQVECKNSVLYGFDSAGTLYTIIFFDDQLI